jgi:hypothetical protein
MQALTVDAKFAGRLRPAQHQHCEKRRGLLRYVHHALDVVRVTRNAPAAPLDDQKHAFQAVDPACTSVSDALRTGSRLDF